MNWEKGVAEAAPFFMCIPGNNKSIQFLSHIYRILTTYCISLFLLETFKET